MGRARIAIAQKKFDEARSLLQPVADEALKATQPSAGSERACSQAFYLLGQIKEMEGDFSGALEDYLRTVAVFYQDSAAVDAAQGRADALRKDHKNVVVP